MPYGNPGGYRKRNGSGRGGRGSGGTAALVSQLQAVLSNFSRGGGGGMRRGGQAGRLGKGARAMARTRAQRVGENVGLGFDDDSEGNYGASPRGPLRIGHRM